VLAFSLSFFHLLTQTVRTTPMPGNGTILASQPMHTATAHIRVLAVRLVRLASCSYNSDARPEPDTLRSSQGKRLELSEKEFTDEPGKHRPGKKC
jgi:hypothetical protein